MYAEIVENYGYTAGQAIQFELGGTIPNNAFGTGIPTCLRGDEIVSVDINILFENSILSFSMDAESVKRLGCNKKLIELMDNVIDISITKKIIIITTEDVDFRTGAKQVKSLKDYMIKYNNINAYDCDGNHIWNIYEIVGEINMYFYGGTVTSIEKLSDYYGFMESYYKKGHELYACTAGGYLYIIDLDEKKIIQRLTTK